jgi:Zn-dependent M28 family amino/carboxypeptidase
MRGVCILLVAILGNLFCEAQLPSQVIQADSLRQWVKAISDDSTMGRLSSGIGAGKAAMWIADKFKELGVKPVHGNDGYYNLFESSFGSGRMVGVNVMGAIPGNGKSEKIMIISSHYDHVGTLQENRRFFQPLILTKTSIAWPKNDTIFNGANDNASGVAAMLALASYFQKLPTPDITILFVAFSGEELGMVGSNALLESINAEMVQQVINLEMLGRARGNRPEQQLPFVTSDKHDAWVLDSLNKNFRLLSGQSGNSDFFLSDKYQNQKLYTRSDNYPFGSKKIPANTIMMSNQEDTYYHHPDDEWHTLDYQLMEKVVRAIALGITPFFYLSVPVQ